MPDVFRIRRFFDAAECARLRAEVREAAGRQAPVYGTSGAAATIVPRTRKATLVDVSTTTRERVGQQLLARRPELERHFGVALARCEAPQFVRYVAGDYFVAHQDGNTPLIRDDSLRRRVSAVVFLSAAASAEAGGYAGGALVLHGTPSAPEGPYVLEAEPGTLVAFRSETTHEVTPVLAGERCTIVSWFR
jgi:SM-20-related protein